MADRDKSLVEILKQRLYKRGTFKADISRSPFSPGRENAQTDWQGKLNQSTDKGILNPSVLKKIFLIALFFFGLAVLASGYIIWSGSNVVSADNVGITIKGPSAIKGGNELSLNLIIDNNNSTALESVDLIVTFPAGTREAEHLDKELSRYRKDLGTIAKGESINETVKAVLFGETGKEQEIAVILEYRTPGSNAIFEKRKVYNVLISAAPLDVRLVIPEEVSAGDEIELGIDISADNVTPLENVLVEMQYPIGFQFKSAVPTPLFGNNIWKLGTLSGNATRHIKVVGVLSGEDNEKKLFRVTAGTASSKKESQIAVPYGSTFVTVAMRRSFIDMTVTLNGEATGVIVADPGETIRSDISWTNNLPDKILNAQVLVHFTGNALNQANILPIKGAYRSTDDTIVWKEQHEPRLAVIEPGETFHVNFDFSVLSTSVLGVSLIKNPNIDLEVTIEGTRVVEGSPGETVRTALGRSVKINSDLQLVSRAIYSTGPFVNSGPLPPRANVSTTYTVLWSLVNTTNDLENVSVKSILPSHDTFLNIISPPGANLRYDATRGEVVWTIGRLPAAPTGAPVAEVAFQVNVTPSVAQVGQTIPILSEILVSGRDLFTGETLSDRLPLIDTRISTDPNFQESWSKVSL